MEGLQTDAALTKADRKAMNHQINAIEEAREMISNSAVDRAAYYGSYILSDAEQRQIKKLFPGISGS